MTGLHSRLESAITARLEVARAATPGPWWTPGPDTVGEWTVYGSTWSVASATVSEYTGPFPKLRGGPSGDQANHNAAYIALHGPDDAILRYERDLRVLQRHVPGLAFDALQCEYCASLCHGDGYGCKDPDAPYPCLEIRDLLTVYPEARDG